MTTELTLLAWTLVLAVVQILLPAGFRSGEVKPAYLLGSRDDPAPPPRPVTARLKRAQENLFETLPLFAAGILIAHVAGRNCSWTVWGAMLFFWGRLIYLPLYGFGVPYVRTLAWGVALAGLLLVLAALLLPR